MEKLVEKIKSYLSSQGKKQEERSGVGKWIIGIVAGLVAILGSAILYYKLYKKSKELAKLKHEQDVLKTKKQIALDTQEVLNNQEKANKIHLNVVKYELELKKKEEQLKSIEEERKRTINDIDKISSWDDVDSYLRDK